VNRQVLLEAPATRARHSRRHSVSCLELVRWLAQSSLARALLGARELVPRVRPLVHHRSWRGVSEEAGVAQQRARVRQAQIYSQIVEDVVLKVFIGHIGDAVSAGNGAR
jgi:hypothetical protein